MPTENRSSNTEMVSELLPCPFCGQQDFLIERLDSDASVVICQGLTGPHEACLARGPVGVAQDEAEEQPGRDKAVELWNARAEQHQGEPRQEHCDTCNGLGEVATGTVTHHGYNQPPEPDLEVCPECSGEQRWYVAGDIDRLVRELDALLNGDGAARQAKLCDLVAQVAESKKHQGEPVAIKCWSYKMGGEQRFYPTDPRLHDFGVTMAEYITDVEPLYTRADPGEVERLRAELEEWKKRCQYNADTAHDVGHERDTLRAQLAEAHALLREAIEVFRANALENSVRFFSAALSASAEPSAPLPPVDGDLLPPIGSKVLFHLGREDEWVEHTVVGYYVWGNHGLDQNVHRVFVRARDADGYLNARLLSNLRAALERKP